MTALLVIVAGCLAAGLIGLIAGFRRGVAVGARLADVLASRQASRAYRDGYLQALADHDPPADPDPDPDAARLDQTLAWVVRTATDCPEWN